MYQEAIWESYIIKDSLFALLTSRLFHSILKDILELLRCVFICSIIVYQWLPHKSSLVFVADMECPLKMFITSRLIFPSINSTSLELAQVGSLEWNTEFHRANPGGPNLTWKNSAGLDQRLICTWISGLGGHSMQWARWKLAGGIFSLDGMVKLFLFLMCLWTFIEVFNIDNEW